MPPLSLNWVTCRSDSDYRLFLWVIWISDADLISTLICVLLRPGSYIYLGLNMYMPGSATEWNNKHWNLFNFSSKFNKIIGLWKTGHIVTLGLFIVLLKLMATLMHHIANTSIANWSSFVEWILLTLYSNNWGFHQNRKYEPDIDCKASYIDGQYSKFRSHMLRLCCEFRKMCILLISVLIICVQ